jgi:hypothetical protein
MSAVANRKQEVMSLVGEVEQFMLTQEQAECPVVHYFAPGICVREVSMKAGTMAIGQYQKYDHLNVFLKGKVRMLQEDGTFMDVSAPLIYVGKPGKKVGYIIEDMVWQNIYATDLTDIDEIEAYFLDMKQVEPHVECDQPQSDFLLALDDIGVSQDVVAFESSIDSDLIDFPFGAVTTRVSDSPINGKGLFATANMSDGFRIPARLDGKKTPAGRYTNHSNTPNVTPEALENGDVYFVCNRDISGQHGGMKGEEITVDYRAAYIAAGRK